MADRLLGIDSGGTMTKVGLFDLDGHELGVESRPNPMSFPADGHTERDPDQMWRAAAEAIRNVLERTGTAPGEVAGIAPSGFGAGAFFVDREGASVRPAIVSTDVRSKDIVSQWRTDGRAAEAEKVVKTRIHPGHTPAILGWLSRHERGALKATDKVLWCKDFLKLRLTGEISTDFTDVTCPGLWDYERNDYARDAMGALGIGEWADKLPDVGPASEIGGRVSAEASAACGLLEGTPVASGVYDIIACSLASGVTGRDQLGMIGGTFAINSTLHKKPTLDPLPNHQSVYPIGDMCLASTASATSGSNLQWVLNTFLGPEKARLSDDGRSLYDHVNQLVDDNLSRRCSMTFLPFLFSDEPAGLIGMNASDGLGDVLRAIFEGVVCSHRFDFESVLSKGKDAASPTSMRLAGGVAQSDVWAQMFADGFNMPVAIASGHEFGAKGTAMCAAVAIGAISDLNEAVSKKVHIERHFDPRPERTTELEKTYARFIRLRNCLIEASA